MKTDDEVRRIMDRACRDDASKYMREFAEEVVAMRQRIAKLEETLVTLEQLIGIQDAREGGIHDK